MVQHQHLTNNCRFNAQGYFCHFSTILIFIIMNICYKQYIPLRIYLSKCFLIQLARVKPEPSTYSVWGMYVYNPRSHFTVHICLANWICDLSITFGQIRENSLSSTKRKVSSNTVLRHVSTLKYYGHNQTDISLVVSSRLPN